MPALLKIHQRGERFRVETCSADKCAVQFFLGHQTLNVVGFDAATVENPQGGGEVDGKSLTCASPENAMGFGGNFRGRGAARADGPNGFVSNQNTGELLRCQRAGATVELAAEHLFGEAGVAIFLCFTYANNRSEAAGQGHQGFLGDIVIGLAKKLAALGVADDNVAAARFGKHGGGNFAGEGAFLAPGDVLAGDGDVRTFCGVDGSSYGRERGGDYYVAMLGV